MSAWAYVAVCVVGPALWGVLMYLVFELVDRRRRRYRPDREPPVDYSI